MKTLRKHLIEIAKDKSTDEIKEMIDDIIGEIDSIMDRLQLDGENKPLRLMGLKATFSLMNQIYTTLATVGFAIAQRLIQ